MKSGPKNKGDNAPSFTNLPSNNRCVSPLAPLSIRASRSDALLASSSSPSLSSLSTADGSTPQPSYKRQELSFAERIDVIAVHRATGKSLRQLAAQFGCGKTQILNILSHSEQYQREWEEKAAGTNPHISKRKRRSRLTGNEETNKLVWQWYNTQKESGVNRITGPMMQREARSIARRLGITNFTASNGWLERFRRIHNIGPRKSRRMSRDARSPVTVKNNEGDNIESDRPTLSSIPIDLLFQLEPLSSNTVAVNEDIRPFVHHQQQQQEAVMCVPIPAEVAPYSFTPFHLPSIETIHHKGRHYYQWEDNSIENINNQPFHCDLRHLHFDRDLLMIQNDRQQALSDQQLREAEFQNVDIDRNQQCDAPAGNFPPSQSTVSEEEVNRFADQFSLGACIYQQQSPTPTTVADNNNQLIPLYQQEHLYEPQFDTATVNVDFHSLETVVNSSPSFNDDRYQQRVDAQFPLVQAQTDSHEEESCEMFPTFTPQQRCDETAMKTAAATIIEEQPLMAAVVDSSSSLVQTKIPIQDQVDDSTSQSALFDQNQMYTDDNDQRLMNSLAGSEQCTTF